MQHPPQFSAAEYVNDYYPVPSTKLDLMHDTALYPSVQPVTVPSNASFYGSPPSAGAYYDPSFGFSSMQPGSPDSFMSAMTPSTPPIVMRQDPPMLVASSSSSTVSSTSSTAFLSETFAKVSSLPESFYPEFLQYSKETYEQQSVTKKRKAQDDTIPTQHDNSDKDQLSSNFAEYRKHRKLDHQRSPSPQEDSGSDDGTSDDMRTTAEMRRQIHIQSEQKRRAQIKDGFEELRNELPACLNKKMSKVVLLHRTVQHIQHLKSTQMVILAELERLVHENEQLRSFQQGVLQKQALENMYSIGTM
ncbi:uncharacterized protein BYT42DRAFT_572497 [Radiomyces spectabilis]|uniref:uncharacterized protein n=1 Tax=Radiomyces spectabilis TaxID=64574 RepID=UPI00221FF95C|nr:uncharacterized protein BYT42DRAFT_572497 [Radiomyces spectabilis]KAI8378036.1 hypothetical protein BYT42DRAFT_572497 [Radiomyces spectabilis]